MNENQQTQLKNALEAVGKREIHQVYFAACGGSKAIFEPVQYIFDVESAIPCAVYTSNEFIHRAPKALGKNSLFVSCSHSGNTPETVAATAFARKSGALTISLSFKEDSELWNAAEYGISYTWGPGSNPAESNNAILYRLIFGVLNTLAPDEKYTRAIQCVDALETLLPENQDLWQSKAQAYGKAYRKEPLIYTMSSGACYGVAYSFAICLLMEMQWIHCPLINTGEFFHGPFEIVDRALSFVLFVSEGRNRPVDERALDFLNKYAERVTVIDAKELFVNRIDDTVCEYFNHFVFDVAQRRLLANMAALREHDCMARRYMWHVKY